MTVADPGRGEGGWRGGSAWAAGGLGNPVRDVLGNPPNARLRKGSTHYQARAKWPELKPQQWGINVAANPPMPQGGLGDLGSCCFQGSLGRSPPCWHLCPPQELL